LVDLCHFKLTSFLVSIVSLETFSCPLESDISVKKLLVRVVPFNSMLILEVLFVLVHQAHEVDSELRAEKELRSDEIGNGTEVQ